MNMTNALYTFTQIIHNFGAVAVVGGSILAMWPFPQTVNARRELAWLVLVGWIIQGLSGAGFGTISYISYGKLPDIHRIAQSALLLKLVCTVVGFVVTAAYLKNESYNKLWTWGMACSSIALIAAAFLRWYS